MLKENLFFSPGVQYAYMEAVTIVSLDEALKSRSAFACVSAH